MSFKLLKCHPILNSSIIQNLHIYNLLIPRSLHEMTFSQLLGILPFIALIVINLKIYRVLQRRRAISSRLTNNPSNQLKQRAASQAHVLFVICIVFLICHLLRVALGIHELFVIEIYRQQMSVDCNEVKFSTLVAGSVSTLMLTANSSLNFVIYALMSKEFRILLREKLWQAWPFKKYANVSQTSGSSMELNNINHNIKAQVETGSLQRKMDEDLEENEILNVSSQ